MRKIGYIYDDVFLGHETPEWHPERRERLVAINDHLRARGLWDKLVHLPPRLATVEEISRVHDRAYVEELGGREPGYVDAGDTYLSAGSYTAACMAAGGVLSAIEAVSEGKVDGAFCAVRPPGHHAERRFPLGFCLFNNVAVGVRHAQKRGYETVAVVDFDVHHGNGTQHMFEDDPSVLYVSTHQSPHYPGTGSRDEIGKGAGKGYTVNFPLPAGTSASELLPLYQGPIREKLSSFAPKLLLVSAGYDLRSEDPLAQFRVDGDTIRAIVRTLIDAADVSVVMSLEGGYDLSALADSVACTIEEMMAPVASSNP